MTWIIIRSINDPNELQELQEKLNKRLRSFASRHNIVFTNEWLPPQDVIEYYFENDRNKWGNYAPEYYLYRRVVARALGHPQATGIAYNAIGYSCD